MAAVIKVDPFNLIEDGVHVQLCVFLPRLSLLQEGVWLQPHDEMCYSLFFNTQLLKQQLNPLL